MEEIQVPPFFICPISLEIMRDPVTVWTGITYDRDSIERWIFSGNNRTCPVTKQALTDTDLTPNHTLRRLIQAWCTLNASYGVERIPTPRPPIDKAQITKLMEGAMHPKTQMRSLQKLKSIAGESERNRRCMEAAGVVTFLASILKNASSAAEGVDDSAVSDEVLSILYYLRISHKGLSELASTNTDFIASLTHVLQRSGNCHSRAYATFLLKSIFQVLDPVHMIGLKPEMFRGVVNVLRDQISHQATKAALQILMEGCPWGRNRIKVVSAGGVSILVELLLEVTERRDCEMMLAVLDHLCGCAEGRADLLAHGAGLAVVSKKILRVSHVASEKGVRILSSIAKFSATPGVLQEMLHVGVVSKLCFVLQLDCSLKAKEKAKEILSLHIKAWKKSPCVPTHLLTWHTSH